MNLIKIQRLIPITLILITSIIYSLSSSNNPNLTINAIITTHDGNKTELNDIRINNGTEILVYTKPTNIQNDNSPEISLTTNPRDNKVGPLQLATTKKIVLKNPKTSYIYQAEGKDNTLNGPKQCYIEVEIDGLSYLIPKGWTLTGTDAGRKKHTMELNIIQTIAITGACAKSDNSSEPAPLNTCTRPQ